MQTRNMDNAYASLGNVPTHIHTPRALFLEIFHQTIHDIQMMCETIGVTAYWCDARLLTAPSLDVCIKGVPICAGTRPAVQL